MVKLEPPTQMPFTAKQPDVRLIPFAAVEEAVPVILSARTFKPEEKVLVADAVLVRIPVLLMLKSVEVAADVEEPIAKSVVAVSPLFVWIANFAYGDEVPTPTEPDVGSTNAVLVAGRVPNTRPPRLRKLFVDAAGKKVL